MKFDEMYNELMFEAEVSENDPLFKQALEILDIIKAKNPNAYAKLLGRLNDLSKVPSTPTKSTNPEDPEDASWIASAKG